MNPPKIQYTGNILEETKSANIQVELQDFSKKRIRLVGRIWYFFGDIKKI